MVVSLPARIRVYVATGATDMRKAFDGLCAIVEHHFHRDPYEGDLFAFFNRRGDRVKLLLWDSNGFWLLCKRLERGTFASWPTEDDNATHVEIDRVKLMMLLEGIDAKSARFRNHFTRSIRIDRQHGRWQETARRREPE
jgi:transposase